MPKARYTRDRVRGGYRFNFRQANGKYTTLRAATVPEMDNLIRQKTKEREAALKQKAPGSMTVSELTTRWLRVASDGLTLYGEKALANSARHIMTALGDREIASIVPADIDDLVLNLPGSSKSGREKVLATMRRICQYAMDNGYILRDPTARKKAGGKDADEVTPLTREQQTILLDAVKGTRAYLLCLLILRTGLRPEEARGLTWDAIDFDNATLQVQKTVIFDGNHPIVSKDLKTLSARRKLPIPRDLLEALKQERESSTCDYILAGNRGPMSRQEFQNTWKLVRNRTRRPDEPLCNRNTKVQRTITFPVKPYQLRHTYITELCAHSAETGLDIKTIQYLAGHANPQITLNIYAHVIAERQQDTAEKVQAIFDMPSP